MIHIIFVHIAYLQPWPPTPVTGSYYFGPVQICCCMHLCSPQFPTSINYHLSSHKQEAGAEQAVSGAAAGQCTDNPCTHLGLHLTGRQSLVSDVNDAGLTGSNDWGSLCFVSDEPYLHLSLHAEERWS